MLVRLLTTAATVLLTASLAVACPLCESATGREVRAGIFDKHFAATLLAVLLPFPVLAAVVALIYRGPPWSEPVEEPRP